MSENEDRRERLLRRLATIAQVEREGAFRGYEMIQAFHAMRTVLLTAGIEPNAEEKWPRCPDCGGDVVLTARAGRTREIERGVHVEIPSDVKIPTCTECGEESMSLDVSEPLDALLNARRRRSAVAPGPTDLPSEGD